MADFKPFSLSESMQAGQKLAGGFAAIQDVASSRKKSGKTAVLRQRMVEGDPEAFSELAGLDIDQAKKTMDAVKTMDDNKREEIKVQNDAIAKAGMWIMQGANDQEQSQRYDQAIDHMENQGMDMANYKGKFSPQIVQNSIMQSMTISQMIDSVTQKGVNKGIDPKTGEPVFFSTGAISGEPTIMKDVKPSPYQVHGKQPGGAGKGRKASDSNAIAKRIGESLGATWTKDPESGALNFTFKSDADARKAAEIGAIAERIFTAEPTLLHSQVSQKAIKEWEAQNEGEKKKEPTQKGKSISDYLKGQIKGG